MDDEDDDWDDENYCPCGGCADMEAAEAERGLISKGTNNDAG